MTIASAQQAARPVPKGFKVRPANASDIKSIVQVGAHTFTVTFGHSVEPHELQAYLDEAYTDAAIQTDLEDKNKDIIVAVDVNGTVLGFAYLTRGSTEPCLEHIESTVELQRIYVHPSAHGKGIGRLLSDGIDSMARSQGFQNLWLGVWEENAGALVAYRKWGYSVVGSHDFVVGSVVQTDHIMLKRL